MPNPGLTEELMKEAVLAVAEHGTVAAAAEALGIPRPTLQHRYRRATAAGLSYALQRIPVRYTL